MDPTTRKQTYSFQEFLDRRDTYDFYRDNPFFQELLRSFVSEGEFPALHEQLLQFSPKVSNRWRDLAEQAARPELHPVLQHYNAYNQRIDRIVRSEQALALEREIFSEGLFSGKTAPWELISKRFLLHQNGEAGVMCPLACTEGLIALIEHFPEDQTPELEHILAHCKEGIEGDFAMGAQFMTEIQGGSDIPANQLEAVPEPDGKRFRLYGQKFFCSATQADYTVVTAKVRGSDKVSTFIVPSWLPGNKEKEIRNDYTIRRLKRKLGTTELPTGEIEYQGAVAYPVGPLHKGVAVPVGIVLTLSRMDIGLASGAFMMRAAREAQMYAEFRKAFGRRVIDFAMAAGQVRAIVHAARRTTAGAFKINELYIRLGRKHRTGLPVDQEDNIQKQHFMLRILILMQKVTAAKEAVDVLRQAISLFGGNGAIEDFSSLPRIFRDAMVNELWEGPKNVLLTQIYRDLGRVQNLISPKEFVSMALAGAPQEVQNHLSRELLQHLTSSSFLAGSTDEAIKQAEDWEDFVDHFFKTYQQIAVEPFGSLPVLN
ncbi:acyl-CoA dehydrogenase family protein [Paenactinomyces guangxiensis]|uniref:Acyl-CoA dehydrogenase family protein n=1 Tax=Paenactinomyces guangxiensis TaxID=1490290 RepID=A0A7W1WTZ3_9BACL|nr:acyl-CoA dehydrogenase family protein [Paenactinomyces guangxiensis]MBA4496026.1 acyl-CoA dehydrogenase family protein [Paenactinomyces guangxiensis]MBH8593098.1 acyl-CoA dehydrogenase family protein [Paenactinomyces guangxiensis]